jgi:hypothetical protein
MEYKSLADIRAADAEARRVQGNTAANMTPGRGIVSSMGQLGGMLGGQVMNAFGQYSPEEAKAMSLDKILGSRKGPPKTLEEAEVLSAELAQAGHAQEARQAMLNYQTDRQSALKTEGAELDVNIKKNKPALEAKWLKTEESAATSTWVKDNLSFYDIKDAPDKLKNPTSPSGITNLIIWLAKNDDNLESGKAGSLVSAYKEHMAATKKRYLDINAASFKPNTEVKQDRPLSSIQGRGNYVIPTPPSNVPIGGA